MRKIKPNAKIIRICVATHCGGLDEMLKTQKEICIGDFLRIVNQYQWFCYDERIKAYRMLIRNLEKNCNKHRDWLLIYVNTQCDGIIGNVEKL